MLGVVMLNAMAPLFRYFFNLFTAFQDSVECVLMLLANKAEVNARDIYKRTPLMMAAYNGNDKVVGKYF
jgi:ankyrin repeat protein